MGETKVDVLIVGGGLAGCVTANRLLGKNPGCKVAVVEALDRIGGKMLTNDQCDLGAQWLGTCQPYIMRLVHELKLSLIEQENIEAGPVPAPDPKDRASLPSIFSRSRPASQSQPTLAGLLSMNGRLHKSTGSGPFSLPGGLPLRVLLDLGVSVVRLQISAAWHRLRTRYPYTPDVQVAQRWDAQTVEHWIQENVWTCMGREMMRLAVRMLFGAEATELSFLYLMLYVKAANGFYNLLSSACDGAQGLRVVGGAQQICERLADSVCDRSNGSLYLGCRVTSMVVATEAVFVTAHSPTGRALRFRARHVVMAMAPNLVERIKVVPPWPIHHIELQRKMLNGVYTKWCVVYAEPFWRFLGFNGEVLNIDKSGTDWAAVFDVSDSNKNALAVFYVGNGAKVLSCLSKSEQQTRVVQTLCTLFGKMAANPERVVAKAWFQDEHFQGGPVNYAPCGLLTTAGHILQTSYPRVHFASTDRSPTWIGYMEGAVHSGILTSNYVSAALAFEDPKRISPVSVPVMPLAPLNPPRKRWGLCIGVLTAGILYGTYTMNLWTPASIRHFALQKWHAALQRLAGIP
mmetsp:Transcript_24849/g.62373  ORF Transcript_24849/g.62373 Transcript_24849/m.62373 type:complete len:573 (-) Transcript_24849:1503-3221(-)